MNSFIAFTSAHQAVVCTLSYALYSALCSSMPPLRQDAGFWLTWLHNFLQAVAGNVNKIKG